MSASTESIGILGKKFKKSKKNQTTLSTKGYFAKTRLLYLMLLPAILVTLLFKYYPMFGIQLAFKDWSPMSGIWGSPWATDVEGNLDLLKHFRRLFDDPYFWKTFFNTIRIAGFRILFGFPIPIIIAILLNEMKNKFIRNTVQTISYLPHFVSWVIIANILIIMMSADSSFQLFLEKLLGKQIYFFSNPKLFLGIITASEVWKSCGWSTIIYFAALSSIDPELYEAAEVDGAGRWKKILNITIPGILPAITIRLIFTISGLASANFDQIFNMYNTTVYETGDVLSTYLYRTGIGSGQYDISEALSVFNSLISLSLTLITNRVIKKMGGEGIW